MARYSLSQLETLTESKLVGDPDYEIEGIEQLDLAGPSQAAFLENPRYEKCLQDTKAGVVIVHPSQKLCEGKNYLLHSHPSFAFQKVIELFFGPMLSGFEDIHPTAVIHKTAKIGKNVSIGPYTVIDKDVVIGDGSVLGPGCYVGIKTQIGEECEIHAHVTIRENCHVKNRVVIQPGAIIGSCGYGYHTDGKGHHHKLRQLGNVIIEDDVEIGANTTIDRARFKSTVIGKGTKIDNLVQIAHSVEVGDHNLIVSQVGIAGSTKTGRNVVLGGQVGVSGHITLGDETIFAARSGVSKSIEKAGIYSGAPAMPIKETNETWFRIKSVKRISERLRELEKKVAAWEEKYQNAQLEN